MYVCCLPLVDVPLIDLAGKIVTPADLAFLGLLASLAFGRGLVLRPTAPVLLALAGLVVGVTLVSAAVHSEGWLPAARLAYSLVVLVVLAQLRLARELARRVAAAWAATSIVTCVVGLVAYVAVAGLGASPGRLAHANSPNIGPDFVRIGGLLPTNSLPLYLGFTLAFGVFLVATGSLAERRLGRAALACGLVVAPFTFSRGLLGLLLTALLIAHLPAAPERLVGARKPLWAAFVVLLVLTAASTRFALLPPRFEPGASTPRMNAYWLLHVAAVRMTDAAPWLGVGPGRYAARFAEFTTTTERQASWPPIQERMEAHSIWLKWAAECGALGLSAWGALWTWTLRRLFSAPPDAGPLPGLLAAAVAGVLLNGLHVDFSSLKLVWAAAGLGLAATATHEIA